MKKAVPFLRAFCFVSLALPLRFADGARTGSAANTPPPTLEEDSRAGLVDGGEVTKLVNSAKDKFKRSDYKEVIANCTRLIELAPRNVWVHNLRGLAKENSGDLAGALADFELAIALEPGRHPVPYVGRGYIKARKGDLAGAADDFQRALKIDPKHGPAYIGIGGIKQIRKDYLGAEANYTRAIILSPNAVSAYEGRGWARYRLGRFEDAISDANHMISLAPKSANAYELRAVCKHVQGDLAGTIADYRRSLELSPKNTWILRAIAYTEMQQRHYDAALDDVQRSLRDLVGQDADYGQFLAWILRCRLGQPQDADQKLSSYFTARKHTADGEWPDHIGAFLLGRESEQTFTAHASSGDAKKIDGQHCEAWYYAGIKKLLTGDKATAADCFRKSLATGQKTFIEFQLAQSELQSL